MKAPNIPARPGTPTNATKPAQASVLSPIVVVPPMICASSSSDSNAGTTAPVTNPPLTTDRHDTPPLPRRAINIGRPTASAMNIVTPITTGSALSKSVAQAMGTDTIAAAVATATSPAHPLG